MFDRKDVWLPWIGPRKGFVHTTQFNAGLERLGSPRAVLKSVARVAAKLAAQIAAELAAVPLSDGNVLANFGTRGIFFSILYPADSRTPLI